LLPLILNSQGVLRSPLSCSHPCLDSWGVLSCVADKDVPPLVILPSPMLNEIMLSLEPFGTLNAITLSQTRQILCTFSTFVLG
jgi:hypothetical protein